jgi:hypothetical protein
MISNYDGRCCGFVSDEDPGRPAEMADVMEIVSKALDGVKSDNGQLIRQMTKLMEAQATRFMTADSDVRSPAINAQMRFMITTLSLLDKSEFGENV